MRPQSAAPVRAPTVQPRPRPAISTPRVEPRERDRRMMMWGGVVIASVVIFILWVAVLRLDLSQPAGSDSLWSRLKTELQRIFSFSDSENTNVNAEDRELNELRNSVFPSINDSTFDTGDTTNLNAVSPFSNLNENRNLNTTPNANAQ